ncbi:FAD-binding oxidoreductase [Luedemannella helvata]|uniref:FAD-binding oxidoreductase n=1 Tax=Luedemannella helvata TaxID=349315 RepID=A0ABP4VTT5_9ACTN
MSSDRDTLLRGRVADICGLDNIRDGADGDAVGGLVPPVVASPGSPREVSEVVRAVAAAGRCLTVTGNRTALAMGPPPRRLDVLLSTRRLNRVVEHSPGDLQVTAEAGLSLAELQRHLAGHGQRLALDVAGERTVGGIIAANASGPLRHRYGSVRDLLIGVQLVRADGTPARAGGKVVKNVAGYDLCKLMTGSYGTLAVIVAATFRLHARARASQWTRHEIDGPAGVRAVVSAYARARVEPSAIELDYDLRTGTGVVETLMEGSPPGVAARCARVGDVLDGVAVPHPVAATEGTADDLVLKVVVAPAAVADTLERFHAIPPVAEGGAHVSGRAGVGVLRLTVAAPPPGSVPALVTAVRAVAGELDGSAVVTRAPRATSADLDVWGPVRGLDLMRRVKEQFDPGGVLSPGRFVGGI